MSTAWLHPGEFGAALGARAAPFGGFAFTDEPRGLGGGIYFCLELPQRTTRLRLAAAAAPLGSGPSLLGAFALPRRGSTALADVSLGTPASEGEGAAPAGAAEAAWRPVSLDLAVPLSHSVLDLKWKIAREWHVPAEAQCLTIPSLQARGELRDEDTLAASGCKAGAVYELKLQQRPISS